MAMSERSDQLERELLALRNKNGVIVPSEVVKWARRNTKSWLHAALNWDDKTAGEAWRIWQVREIISIQIVSKDAGRQLVSLSIDRASGGGYRRVSDIMERPDLRDVMLADALADLERMQKRYAQVQELRAVWDAANAVAARRKRKAAA